MSAANEILAFCGPREAWQQDLVRRLFTQEEIADSDIGEVLCILKAQYGLTGETPAPAAVPVTAAHVPQQVADAEPVVLNSLADLVNTNRLATGQLLPFGIAGLTVVYGDNGSGKSGYCRILKKLCRVREGGQEDIRGNAFDAASAISKAEATVRFTIGGGQTTETRWKNGATTPEALSRISVFDARVAALYADQQNRIEFLPHGLDIMKRLGEACEKLSALVDVERGRLEQRLAILLPGVPVGTSSAALFARLTKTTPAQDLPTKTAIETACAWTEEHTRDLEQVESSLQQDPSELAVKCGRIAKTVEGLANELQTVTGRLDDASMINRQASWEAARVARDAAALAAAQGKQGDLLPGFGSSAWRLLFQYAKAYSAIAYPEKIFPMVDQGARCVLCQQQLGAEAVARFQTFDTYVQGAAEAHATHTERARDLMKADLESMALRAPADSHVLLDSLIGEDARAQEVATAVAAYLQALEDRRRSALTAYADGRWSELQALPPSPASDLAEIGSELLRKAAAHVANGDPAVRRALEAKGAELRGRTTLRESLQVILRRREDLDTLSRLNHCKTACDTKAISQKTTELRKQYLTKEFEARLIAEIREFNLGYLPFKIQEKTDHGASFIGIGLEAPVKVRNHDVLSDGEFRALALACFLAEVNNIPGHNGVIIDDPVSSLDHLRTHVVAERLVREAKGRQVIVFTHDLLFYQEILDSAAEQEVPLVQHWIRRTDEQGFGMISANEAPWQAKPVHQRLDALNRKLAQVRKIDPGAGDPFRGAVKDLYTDVRETWERLVEELLFNGTVTRLQLGVKTQSIGGVTVSDDDHKRIFFGMKRASRFSGHDRAQAAQMAPPTFEEMQKDIEGLKAYADELKKRNRKQEEERRGLEKAPAGTTA